MSFPSQAPVVFTFDVAYDPAADEVYTIFQCPTGRQFTILSACAWVANDVAAHTDNYFTVALQNGGTAGTASTAVAAAIGGTAGWTGMLPKAFTVSADELTAGEVLKVAYDETGTGTFGQLGVQVVGVWGEV
jgi:hypothetical protein